MYRLVWSEWGLVWGAIRGGPLLVPSGFVMRMQDLRYAGDTKLGVCSKPCARASFEA